MKKKYKFCYNHEYEIILEVDLDIFTEDQAKAFLAFYYWDKRIDLDSNIIIQALEKIALKCFTIATHYCYSINEIIYEFEELEAFPRIDGSSGITLLHVDMFESNDEYLIELISMQND